MNPHSILKPLVPFLDEIMETFYDEMLSHHQISVFFDGEEHIQRLIAKQKQNFIDSLDDDPDELKNRYVKLGSLHYDLRVPSADFLKSTELWKSSFVQCVVKTSGNEQLTSGNIQLIVAIDDYFKLVDTYMAEGYLSKQLEMDKKDIQKLIQRYEGNNELQSSEALSHLQWLFQILEAIGKRDLSLAPELDADKCNVHNIFDSFPRDIEPVFSKDHYDDLHHRLHIDAKSLFYFIEKNNYPEVLSLYSNLLSVYKITLITIGNFNLAQTISHLKNNLEKADKEIATLRGIIPICSYCHSIRNEDGVWDQLEKYVTEHSEAKFSHGICNKCLPKAKDEMGI